MKSILKFINVSLLVIFIQSCGNGFNEEEWNSSIYTRKEMVSDLTENILPNKSKEEIIKMLGKPNTEYFQNENTLVYNLGFEDAFISIDNEWLLIYLDSNNKFLSHEIKTD